MNKLLNKSFRSFSIYALFVLAASVPAYYYLVDDIWLKELDEHNAIVALRTEHELNKMRLTDAELTKSIELWNHIQPGTALKEVQSNSKITDSLFIELRQNPYLSRVEIDRFRGLKKQIKINGKSFLLTVETNVEETEETVAAIAIVTLIFFLVLVLGFLLLNRRLSKILWRPFRISLKNLQEFNLNHQQPIHFPETNILEFKELNQALEKLISHTISVYKGQKEFTENASHELQTPLAIVKGKLNLLLQDEPLTQRQYQIIEEIDHAINRISKINKNLLILAKIENHQFEDNEMINLSETLEKILDELSKHGNVTEIPKLDEITQEVLVFGNKTLIEILVGNLLSNAIRYQEPIGKINIKLSPYHLLISNSGTVSLPMEKLFKRFSSKSKYGSGLGLAIIKEVCVSKGWKIDYQFENNKHTFIISFKSNASLKIRN